MMEWRKLVDLGRKENRKSKRFKYLGYTFNKRATNCKAHIREIGSGMCLGNRREKVGR
jgi:hypothetical protein